MDDKSAKLPEKLFRIGILMHRFQSHRFKTYGPWGDPHRGQGRVLSLLKIKPEISQKELSYLLDMRSQSLGELLSKLEKNGLITRTPSETDRRVMMIKLTEEGENAVAQGEPKDKYFMSILKCLSEDEQDQLGVIFDKIIAELETRLEAEGIQDDNFKPMWGPGMPPPPFDPREMLRKMKGFRPFPDPFGDEDDADENEINK